jgi:flagellar biosynthesis/type III secretory pathway M-ring protein FliF/YscJ
MEAFKQQLQRIQQQLAGLTATQRMLVFSLVAVMVLTVLLWSRYAATPDMVPLLNQAVRDADLVQIQSAIQARGINIRTTGGNVMVSPDDRLRALAVITSQNLLPGGASNLMDEFFAGGSAFDTQDKNNKRWMVFRAQQLRNTLMMMDEIKDAQVTLDLVHQPRFGQSISPTAGVFLSTKTPGQRPNRSMVEGIAGLVMGTAAGIKRSDVKIVVDGRPCSLDSPLGAGGGDLLEVQSGWEMHYARKVTDALTFIPGVHVSVAVRINTESKQTHTQQYDEIKSKESEIAPKTSESTQTAPQITDPGAVANTGTLLAVPTAGIAGNTTSTEDTTTKMQNFPSSREEHATKPSGEPTVLSATVAIPRSWFANQLKGISASAQEPDLNAIDNKIAAERPSLVESVQKTLGLADSSSVHITTYADAPTDLGVPGSGGGPSGMFTMTVGGHMKEIVIGVLAAASLLMISMIVRKGNPQPLVVPQPAKKSLEDDVQEVNGNELLAGIAAAGNPTLEAMELGDEDLKNQQMVEQVSSMVKENPDSAAQLVKRWLNRS